MEDLPAFVVIVVMTIVPILKDIAMSHGKVNLLLKKYRYSLYFLSGN